MDPTHQGPEEYGRDGEGPGGTAGGRKPVPAPSPGAAPRPGRGISTAPDHGQQTSHPARVVRVISGDYLLTVNPVDGSEVELYPPGEQPAPPVRRTAADRADRERAAAPPVPPGPPAPQPPLLERTEERERLVRLLTRGRSVRLTGPAGSGRTTLLNAVAADCAGLAPDGVVRLFGHNRSAADLLYALFEAVYDAPLHRPDRAALLDHVRGIGAVVVLDDLEFGGAALEELLDATPECAFLFAATPDVPAPGADSYVEEVFLPGLGRSSSVELLERVAERPLTDEEKNWAGDLWFESEGLPLRFVQAAALLRRRDQLRADPDARGASDPDDGMGGPSARPPFGHDEATDGVHIPLPNLGEAAAPAALLASELSGAARDTLRFAVALGGEVPHQAHLPALVGDTHADAALGELAGCGLLSPAGSRYRLAAGALAQLEAAGYGDDRAERGRTAARHYAWWAGHPSVTPARVTAEADAVIAAMTRLVPGGEGDGQADAAVLLARSASPAFAAGLHWGAWEKALRIGQEAARLAGEIAEEAYFHHELGILALCSGNPDRARTELETSIGMRGALADKPGMVVGRRALALVADRSGATPPGAPVPGRPPSAGPVPGGPVPGGPVPVGRSASASRHEETAPLPTGPVTAATQKPARGSGVDTTAVIHLRSNSATAPGAGAQKGRSALLGGARRNVVAVGAAALLAAVLGTVVVLGVTSDGGGARGNHPGVTSEESAGPDDGGNGASDDGPVDGSPYGDETSGGGTVTPGPSGSGVAPSGSGTPSPGATEPSGSPSSGTPTDAASSPGTPTGPGVPTKPATPTPPVSPSPSETEDNSPEPTDPPTEEPSPSPPQDTSDSASGPSSSSLPSSRLWSSAQGMDEGPAVV
ncbi:ATP-binding protein [Streptomyces sp. NPDC047987]|uniref:ATP-binding protein n=1 Tax=unclassified Streptomyces TaxID=2593676 RepID=UPI0034493440